MAIRELIAAALLAFVQNPDPLVRELEAHEWELSRAFVNRTYDIGVDYYKEGRRQEATWFFQRTLDLVPNNGAIRNLVTLIQDYDNPVWKKKEWKNPKAGVDAKFRKEAAKWEEECAKIYFEMGRFAGSKKGEVATEKATEYFLRILRMTNDPIEVGADRRVKARKCGPVPEPFSAEIVKNHLVRINGQLYLRDAMLRTIPDVESIQEAKGAHFLVRIQGSQEKADALLRSMEQAYDRYVAATGQGAMKQLGLLVLADRAGYERLCHASGNGALSQASGFASSALGFAVTFDQPKLESIAAHEGAHLFHSTVYRSYMPSWYDEGFACSFEADDAARIGALLKKTLPLNEILRGSAADRIGAKDGSSETFYAQSLALFTFLRTTTDPRFASRFAKWESFCLGAGYDKVAAGTRASELFDKELGIVAPALEAALQQWIAARAEGNKAK